MATTHSTAAHNAATAAVTALIDAGSAAGKLKFRLTGTVSSPGTAVATLTFSDPAFGSPSAGTATASAITSDTNATGNASPVATATFDDSDDNVVVHCAVAASSSDINLGGGLTIGAGDTVACSSLTYKALNA